FVGTANPAAKVKVKARLERLMSLIINRRALIHVVLGERLSPSRGARPAENQPVRVRHAGFADRTAVADELKSDVITGVRRRKKRQDHVRCNDAHLKGTVVIRLNILRRQSAVIENLAALASGNQDPLSARNARAIADERTRRQSELSELNLLRQF